MKEFFQQHMSPERLPFAADVQMCEQAVEINGRRFVPDEFTGYVDFRLAHAFPMVTAYNSSFHAATVANSFQSMRAKVFDFMHHIESYYAGEEDGPKGDKVLGTIMEVEFPRAPMGGWKLSSLEQTPGIRCVAALHKQLKGMDRIIGKHQSGRQNWTVSLEVKYRLMDSGIVLCPRDGAKEIKGAFRDVLEAATPADFKDAGYLYCTFLEAPDELLACYRDRMFRDLYKGWQPVTLLNGLDGEVMFKGAALVDYGAEPTARVSQMLARDLENAPLREGLEKLNASWKKLVDGFSEV